MSACACRPRKRLRAHASMPPRLRCLQGTSHDSLVVLLYGLAILVAGNFLMMALGDAL